MSSIRHKVFISYHHDDQSEVDRFISLFDEKHDIFLTRALGTEMDPSIINSDDVSYVMGRIRELYLRDSTVTIILVGKCTWARRFVDWEIQASLRRGEKYTPNGLLGIVLPSAKEKPIAPNRLKINLADKDGNKLYARWYHYTYDKDTLAVRIDDAFNARTTRRHLIENPRARFTYNRQCT